MTENVQKSHISLIVFLECGLGAYSATQNFSPQAFEMSSRTSSSDHCKSFQLFICQSSVFEDF